MADVSANNSSNATCIPAIDGRLFDLGCLGPALAIILILAFLKRRTNFKLEYCNGHPGLLIPINFLGTFSNRYTIAATFGATASTCLELFTGGKDGLFSLGGPAWLKVFQGIIAVLVYGIIFYPFFACLTTEYKLAGSFLGFLYASIRFCFKLAIDLQCDPSFNEGDSKNLVYLQLVSTLPTYFCLLFIMIRFAVLLFLEVREKWFHPASGVNERAGEIGDNCLVGEAGIEHVRQLLNPGLNSGVADLTWYRRLLYFIYQPRADFKFSTQLISTLLVAGIIVFQLLVSFLGIFVLFGKQYVKLYCANDAQCKDLYGVIFGSLRGAYVICALITVLSMLHFMKCHREHVLQLYRGQRTFAQSVFVSPSVLVGRSLRFSGYQIAYTVAGFFVLGFILALVCVILGVIFKYAKLFFSSEVLDSLKGAGVAMLPTIGMALFLLLFQLFLAQFVFRDRDFPNITITVDNRRLFSIMSYFFFFYNILLGVISCVGRIFKGMLLGVIFLSRIDRTSLMQGFQTWDQAFVAYLGFINLLVAHSHPVMLMFCQLLIDRNKDRGLEQSLPQTQSVQHGGATEKTLLLADRRPVTRAHNYLPVATDDACSRELRLPRLSHKAVNRWHVAVTLLRNPSLIKYRRQGARTVSVSLQGSTNADISALI